MSKRTVELELATPGLDARGQPVRVPLGVAAAPGASDVALPEPDLPGEHMLINLGPQHPATHGVLRLVVELDGETVVRVIPHLGYLHSGFEKLGEYRHYNQIIPLTDRTDYLSPMANNVGFALAAEALMGIEITPRCKVLRLIACEMSRIISHMVWLGTTSIDLGAFTPFLWAFQARERGPVRRAQGSAVPRLRDLRLRRTGGRAWRRLRPLPRPAGGVPPVEPHPDAGARSPSRRPGERVGPTGHPPRQVARDERHGGDDLPLQAGHGGREGARGRGVRRDRESQGRARQLPRLRRHGQAGALAHPAAVVHQPRGPPQDGRGAPALRPDRDQRIGGHRDGRGGSMSASTRPAHDAATEEYQPVFTGKALEQLRDILTRYPTKQGALLPALWLVQQQCG